MTSHVVIDGSNIATEGRKLPNLKQLDQAVAAFLKEHPHDNHTVVVDATFGHRISTKERREYDERISTGKMITPPAGAIGRGDAFVLEIAERANATVLSNDSFQEFHGSHDWLFDEGRLIGGKPVTGIGWVFVFRAPVRGVTSRRAVRDARSSGRNGSGGRNTRNGAARPGNRRPAAGGNKRAPRKAAPKGPTSTKTLNEFVPFIEFVGAHPIGSTVTGTVSRFSSHGAYADVGGAHCYIPLKSIADPPPRSAREIFEIGEEVEFIVASIDTPRRGIDLGVPGFVPPETDEADQPDERQSREDAEAQEASKPRRGRRKASSGPAVDVAAELEAETAQRRAAATRPDGSKPRIGERRRAVKGPAAKRSKLAAQAAGAGGSAAADASAEKSTAAKADAGKNAAAGKRSAKKATAKKAAAKTSATKAPADAGGEPVRIYALAKALELTSKEVLASCASLGIEAKSHSSSIDANDAARVRASLDKASAPSNAQAEATETKTAPAKKKAPAKKRAAAKKAPSKKKPAKKTTAKKAAAKKTAAKKAPAKKRAKSTN